MNKYDAARKVMGDRVEGTHVYLWHPGWVAELKIYSPWVSYPASRQSETEGLTCEGTRPAGRDHKRAKAPSWQRVP